MLDTISTVIDKYSPYHRYGILAKDNYRGITVKDEVYERLETLRARLGKRSIPETIEQLLDDFEKTAVPIQEVQ